jgi:hypothetical protein
MCRWVTATRSRVVLTGVVLHVVTSPCLLGRRIANRPPRRRRFPSFGCRRLTTPWLDTNLTRGTPVEQRRRPRLPQRSAAPRPAVSPAWSAALRSRTAPACPTRPAPPPVTFRARSHRVSCMAKSAPVPGSCNGVVTCNLPEPGRSSPLNRQGPPAPQPRTAPHPQGAHTTRPPPHETPAHSHRQASSPLNCQSALNNGGQWSGSRALRSSALSWLISHTPESGRRRGTGPEPGRLFS